MKDQNSTLIAAYAMARRTRNMLTTLLAGTFVTAQVAPSFASIDNTAQATGTYNGSPANYGSSGATVPVAAAAPSMTITKSIAAIPAVNPTVGLGVDSIHTDAGDTITYSYVVTNSGNVTMNGVVPVDPGPSFNGFAALGTLPLVYSPASATLAPGNSQTFTATYTLTTLDVYHGAGLPAQQLVVNNATATGVYGPSNTTIPVASVNTSQVKTTIVGFPSLSILKTAVLTDKNANKAADVGETITYTYKITNTGTVPMNSVSPTDMHDNGAGGSNTLVALGTKITGETVLPGDVGPLGAGASTDGTANNGIWSVLAPGATVTFTYVHTVLQSEFNHG